METLGLRKLHLGRCLVNIVLEQAHNHVFTFDKYQALLEKGLPVRESFTRGDKPDPDKDYENRVLEQLNIVKQLIASLKKLRFHEETKTINIVFHYVQHKKEGTRLFAGLVLRNPDFAPLPAAEAMVYVQKELGVDRPLRKVLCDELGRPARTLDKAKTDRPLRTLKALLQDESDAVIVREAAAESLGESTRLEALGMLLRFAARDGEQSIRRKALAAAQSVQGFWLPRGGAREVGEEYAKVLADVVEVIATEEEDADRLGDAVGAIALMASVLRETHPDLLVSTAVPALMSVFRGDGSAKRAKIAANLRRNAAEALSAVGPGARPLALEDLHVALFNATTAERPFIERAISVLTETDKAQ
jgi:hypothetical protein